MKSMKKVLPSSLPELKGRTGAIAKPATQGHPVNYKGGRIYLNKGAFRAIRKFPEYGTERKVCVPRYANIQQAWLYALKAIDEYNE